MVFHVPEASSSPLDDAIDRAAADNELTGLVVMVDDPASGFSWSGSRGDLDTVTPFFIASTTKLFTTTIVLRLVESGQLELSTRVADVVDGLDRLHVLEGVDRTHEITIRHLMSQTSGLPDYFQGKQDDGSSLENWLRSGNDRPWDLDDVLVSARAMGAAFAPGEPRKALYSDTNFQLLDRVIEVIDGRAYADAVDHHVVAPLGLQHTWVYRDPVDERPAPMRDGDHPFIIPLAMTSFGPDGGGVATVTDLMLFLRAFFEGRLFGAHLIPGLMTFNRIFFPLQYGVGISRFRLPRIFSPFSPPPDLVGHSGLSGTFAFVDRVSGVYLAGTVNNVTQPSRSFRLMLRLLRSL